MHPFAKVLPMGFSWAFYLAQECLRSIVKRALIEPQFILDQHAPPDASAGQVAVLVYADNGNHVGTCREAVDRDRNNVEKELNRCGLLTHEVMEANTYGVTLGGFFDGVALTLAPTAER